MLFIEPRFILFFLLIFGVYWALRGDRTRKLWLLAVSYTFYAAWDYRFLALIGISTLVDYAAGLGLGRTDTLWRRRLLLGASLATNLGILGYFKYANFFLDQAETLLTAIGFNVSTPALGIILPVGISFYTFQTLSYTIDIYRRELEPTRNLLDIALFVGFFPQLVAGPIVRAKQFLPQTLQRHAWNDVNVRASLVLILVGYTQKAVLADNLAPVVDAYFANPDQYNTVAAWQANMLFWAQIYGDFAGYSNMAIGMAGLLGYQLPKNFDFPFLAHNVADFWSRWHITLSRWINDYVLRPLRKPGQSWPRYGLNIILAMTLFGLWHGAAPKFVLWGALNGLAVVGYRSWRRHRPRRSRADAGWAVGLAATALTLLTVVLIVPLFRAASIEDGLSIMGSMLSPWHTEGQQLTGFAERLGASGLWLLLLGLVATHFLARRGIGSWLYRAPGMAFAGAYGIAVPLALTLTPSAIQPFIYFQF